MPIVTAIADDAQAENILRTGYDLANAYSEKMVVLHVVSKSEVVAQQQGIHSLDDVPKQPLNQEKQRAEEATRRKIEDTLGEYDSEEVDTLIRVGDPAEEILSVGEDSDAQYLVIGGQKRSPAGKALFGSVTQSVLLDADRPVVAIMDSGDNS